MFLYQKKKLEKRFQHMTKRFYLIRRIDDPNLKQAFLSSIPEPLGEETFRLLSSSRKTLQNTTLGELFHLVSRFLDKMCSQNRFLQKYMKQIKQLDKVCNQKELLTKCLSYTSCSCSLKHRKSKHSKSHSSNSSLDTPKIRHIRSHGSS